MSLIIIKCIEVCIIVISFNIYNGVFEFFEENYSALESNGELDKWVSNRNEVMHVLNGDFTQGSLELILNECGVGFSMEN